MRIEELGKYKKVLILGYGIEGKSAEAFLKSKFPNMEVGVTDQKDGENYLDIQTNYELGVKSPGVNKKLVKIPYTTPTNIFFANAKAPIIGITGTKGKSTTTSLIYAMLKTGGYDARLLGNIGKPMIDELDKPTNGKTLYVLELSSYQLDDIKYSPHITLFINVFPEHMDYHGSLNAYKEAKKNIARFAGKDDYFIYNPKFSELEEFAKTIKAQPVKIIDRLPFVPETALKGEHNIANIKAAYTVARLMGVSDEDIAKAVKDFKPLPHRLELVGTFRQITFYDDAISTTPESTIEAIDAIPDIGTIFLGGQDRGYDFGALTEKVIEKGVENIVLFPDSGRKIKEELLKLKVKSGKLKVFETSDMKEAVDLAYKNTPEGKTVLLSCASPSYSVWKNFEEKGDLFQKFVREYAN